MKINEIFYSLQGEGVTMGIPTAFVRLTGCNLRCDWCDTLFAYDEGEEMSIEEIIDAIEEMGKSAAAPLVAIELFDITALDHTYDYDASAVKLIAVFAGTRQLMEATTMDLEAYDDEWRTRTGTPVAINEGERTAREFALVPIPDTGSDPIIGPFFLGEDYPDNTGAQLYTARRDVDIPDWVALFICVRILFKEYARPSPHQDITFADYAKKLAEILWKAAGL